MLRLLIDGQAVPADMFEYTSVDPGGFETLSVTLPDGRTVRPGAPVLVLDGLEIAWMGIVEEPGQRFDGPRATNSVQAVGVGALLKRNPYSTIIIDRSLSRWRAASRGRQINNILLDRSDVGFTVAPDPSDGTPALVEEITGTWGTPTDPNCEAWYDAGDGNLIGQLIYGWERGGNINGADPLWDWQAFLASQDGTGLGDTDLSGNLASVASTGAGTVDATGARRFAVLRLLYSSASASHGTQGTKYAIYWRNIAAVGDHGLPLYTGPDGLVAVAPPDVAADAVRRSRAGFELEITESLAYLAPHLIYPTPVAPEQIVDDMAKLLGWHWGVWEPAGLGSVPRAIFAPPPAAATAVAARSDFDEGLEVVEQLSQMHNRALVGYQLPDGTAGTVTVTKSHPRLPDDQVQTLEFDAGTVGSPAAAETIAAYTLALDQSQSRAAGQGVLPGDVRTAGGTRRPGHLLKPGRDRLRIRDLNASWSLLDADPAIDTFRLRRITVTVTNGQPRSRVEFDAGANLIEVMTARLSAVGQRLGG